MSELLTLGIFGLLLSYSYKADISASLRGK
jgi:hypothetical protein